MSNVAMAAMADDTVAETVYALIGEVRACFIESYTSLRDLSFEQS